MHCYDLLIELVLHALLMFFRLIKRENRDFALDVFAAVNQYSPCFLEIFNHRSWEEDYVMVDISKVCSGMSSG